MLPKKSNIGRSTKHERQQSASRAAEISEEQTARLETERIKASISRAAKARERTCQFKLSFKKVSKHYMMLRAKAFTFRAAGIREEQDT